MSTADDYEDDYDFDDEEGGVSGFVILLITVTILAAFALIVWSAYQKGFKEQAALDNGIPVVAADPQLTKTERIVNGGSGENPEVYATLDGNGPSRVVVNAGDGDPLEGFEQTSSASRTLAQAAEEAKVKEKERNARKAADEEAAAANQNTDAKLAADKLAAEKLAANQAAAEIAAMQAKEDAARLAEETRLAEERRKAAAVAASAATPASTGVSSGDAKSGSHVVQVAAFRSNEEAVTFFKGLEGKHGSFVSNKSMDIQRADLGAKGVYYRLRIGPFSNKTAASTYCTNLKSRGQDCLIKGL